VWYNDYNAVGSDGGTVDDVWKFHATDISFHLQPRRYRRKFTKISMKDFLEIARDDYVNADEANETVEHCSFIINKHMT